jgi:hypothetical protein
MEGGKSFLLPNVSKILVKSYVHLHRDGLEGNMIDFNDMVRSMESMTRDTCIEILPVEPMVFDGLDKVGRELLVAIEIVDSVGGKKE